MLIFDDLEGASFSPLLFDSLSVANPYYAVLFTSVALSQGGHLVPVTATWKANLTPCNVATYAIVGNDGALRA